MHRATPGGTGGVKTIGNYAAVSDLFVDSDYSIVMLGAIYLFIYLFACIARKDSSILCLSIFNN